MSLLLKINVFCKIFLHTTFPLIPLSCKNCVHFAQNCDLFLAVCCDESSTFMRSNVECIEVILPGTTHHSREVVKKQVQKCIILVLTVNIFCAACILFCSFNLIHHCCNHSFVLLHSEYGTI